MTFPTFSFLRLKEVLRLIPISKASWYRGVAAGVYPKPLKIGSRISVYRSDVISALAERIATSNLEGVE